ncbi:hypothetical protein [Methylophaga sp. OBS3]|uniref:hypothetical protein n=1 Tax=Methylophaga sp. OBS3 TaxID=2991934 RepID=UPI002257E115|nr:hypothetical protein [Methylophaga sp. OBS3]MCX4190818.1 hypothetical protein [Methylophaga sp. OBS3]
MDFKQLLENEIAHLGNHYILSKLGYLKPTIKQQSRLSSVISSPHLGIDDTLFDIKYSNKDYIYKLAEICGINKNLAKEFIQSAEVALEKEANTFKPYIFINTGFKRTSQPVFALAASEHLRYLTLPKDLINKPALEQLSIVHEKIDLHLTHSQGVVGIWGNVISYFYVYDRGAALEISPAGKILSSHDDYEPDSHAQLSIKGRELKFG